MKRPDDALPPVEVEVALICDWRKLLVVEQADEAVAVQDWQADLAPQHQRFWEEGWQALSAPPAPTTPKLIPVITTGQGMGAVELAHTYFRRWNCQENAIRDWLIPLNLDTNHGYTKEHVVNSELVKRQRVAQGRQHRLERLAQTCRALYWLPGSSVPKKSVKESSHRSYSLLSTHQTGDDIVLV